MTSAISKPDYERLRCILEQQLGCNVTIAQAKGAGDFLISVYEILLYERSNDDTISTDTTYR